MRILAIETSCDDTAVSIVDVLAGERFRVLAHTSYSQVKTHRKYGGVVPEVAAREHAVMIVPTLRLAFEQARIPLGKVDVIAVTRGPGLMTSLRVGVETARTLSALWKKPLVGVNHIEGHLYSCWPVHGIRGVGKGERPKLPAIALIVSGGHTELILMKGQGQYKLLGRTRDDASGEAFDKVAKLLNLPYPGGPRLAKLAERGNSSAYDFPRPMIATHNLDFSFAGLKTAVRYAMPNRLTPKVKANLAASFQQSVIDVLTAKTLKAVKRYQPKSVLLGGGVAANKLLRQTLNAKLKNNSTKLFIAPLPLCTDNATMIAMAASFHAKRRRFDHWQTLRADPNWELC